MEGEKNRGERVAARLGLECPTCWIYGIAWLSLLCASKDGRLHNAPGTRCSPDHGWVCTEYRPYNIGGPCRLSCFFWKQHENILQKHVSSRVRESSWFICTIDHDLNKGCDHQLGPLAAYSFGCLQTPIFGPAKQWFLVVWFGQHDAMKAYTLPLYIYICVCVCIYIGNARKFPAGTAMKDYVVKGGGTVFDWTNHYFRVPQCK